jgi:hypothetical protein
MPDNKIMQTWGASSATLSKIPILPRREPKDVTRFELIEIAFARSVIMSDVSVMSGCDRFCAGDCVCSLTPPAMTDVDFCVTRIASFPLLKLPISSFKERMTSKLLTLQSYKMYDQKRHLPLSV